MYFNDTHGRVDKTDDFLKRGKNNNLLKEKTALLWIWNFAICVNGKQFQECEKNKCVSSDFQYNSTRPVRSSGILQKTYFQNIFPIFAPDLNAGSENIFIKIMPPQTKLSFSIFGCQVEYVLWPPELEKDKTERNISHFNVGQTSPHINDLLHTLSPIVAPTYTAELSTKSC